jgi:hypothetical protein
MFERPSKSSILAVLAAASASFAAPAPPRVILDVHPDSLQATGSVRTVAAGTDLQAALSTARPGDELVLAAGERYIGNFVLPKKQGLGWITLRSSAMGKLPADGSRVQPWLLSVK